MNDTQGYAVFFYPQALEALGEAIKPYLQDGPAGPHVACDEVDTGGALVEMTVHGRTGAGRDATLELMVPSGMVRMIVSRQNDGAFGFTARASEKTATDAAAHPPLDPANGTGSKTPDAA